ncbi:hypothetical protein PCE1_004742 [Barthelona sp. PCE]
MSLVPVVATGRKADRIIKSLIVSAGDESPVVRDSIIQAIRCLGTESPALCITAIINFLQTERKVSELAEMTMFHSIKAILEDYSGEPEKLPFTNEMIEPIVIFTIYEMTSSKDIKANFQGSCSECIVTLANFFPRVVIKCLCERFEVGKIPHYFLVFTIAKLAEHIPDVFISNSATILARLLPVLGQVRQENYKYCFAAAINSIAIAYLSLDNEPSETPLAASFDLIINWLNVRQAEVQIVCCQAVSRLIKLAPSENRDVMVQAALPKFISLAKKMKGAKLTAGIIDALSILLEVTKHSDFVNMKLVELVPLLLDLEHNALSHMYSDAYSIKLQNAIFRCFEHLSSVHFTVVFNNLVTILEQQIPNVTSYAHASALSCMRQLIMSNEEDFDNYKSSVLSVLVALSSSQNPHTLQTVAQCFLQVADMGWLDADTSAAKRLISFIVRRCSEKRNRDLRQTCLSCLDLMVNIVNLDGVLIPTLMSMFNMREYSPVIFPIVKTLVSIFDRICADGNPVEIDFDVQQTPAALYIIGRLLVHIAAPSFDFCLPEKEVETFVQLLMYLLKFVDEEIAELFTKAFPSINKAISLYGDKPKKLRNIALKLFDQLISTLAIEDLNKLRLSLELCLEAIPWDWNCREIIFSLLGLILRCYSSTSTVKMCLVAYVMKIGMDVENERVAFAKLIGLMAEIHIDLIIEFLIKQQHDARRREKSGFFGSKTVYDENILHMVYSACSGLFKFCPIDVSAPRLDFLIEKLSEFWNIFITDYPISKNLKFAIITTVESMVNSVCNAGTPRQLKKRSFLVDMLNFFSKDLTEVQLPTLIGAYSALITLPPVVLVQDLNNIFRVLLPKLPLNVSDPKLLESITKFFKGLISSNSTSEFLLTLYNELANFLFDSQSQLAVVLIKELLTIFLELATADKLTVFSLLPTIMSVLVCFIHQPRIENSAVEILDCILLLLKINEKVCKDNDSFSMAVQAFDELDLSYLIFDGSITNTFMMKPFENPHEQANPANSLLKKLGKIVGLVLNETQFHEFLEEIVGFLGGCSSSELAVIPATVIAGLFICQRKSINISKICKLISPLVGIAETNKAALLLFSTLYQLNVVETTRWALDNPKVNVGGALASIPMLGRHLLLTAIDRMVNGAQLDTVTRKKKTVTIPVLASHNAGVVLVSALSNPRTKLNFRALSEASISTLDSIHMANSVGHDLNVTLHMCVLMRCFCITEIDGDAADLSMDAVMRVCTTLCEKLQLEIKTFELEDLVNTTAMCVYDIVAKDKTKLDDFKAYMTRYLQSTIHMQRLTSVVCFAECIRHSCHDERMFNMYLNALLSRVDDNVDVVKLYACRGISASIELPHAVQTLAVPVFSALINAMQSSNDLVVIAALSSFKQIVDVCTYTAVDMLISTICREFQKLCYHSNAEVRFGVIDAWTQIITFKDQIDLTEYVIELLPILCVLRADTFIVAETIDHCFDDFFEIGFTKHVPKIEGSKQYNDFVKAFVQVVGTNKHEQFVNMLNRILDFSTHSTFGLRKLCARITALFVSHAPSSIEIPVDTVISTIIKLLKDDNEKVRSEAAMSLGELRKC